MASGPITLWQTKGEKVGAVADFLFLGSKVTADGDCSHEIRRRVLLGRKATTNLDSVLESRDITLLTKVCYSQSYGLPRGHLRLWELDCKELMLEKTPESPLVSKEIKPVHLKRNQSCILIRTTDAEAPVFWSLEGNSEVIGKVPDAEKDWWQKEKRASDDEAAGWHHQCNRHELGQTSGRRWGTGRPAGCSPHGCKKLDTMDNWATTISNPQGLSPACLPSLHIYTEIYTWKSVVTGNPQGLSPSFIPCTYTKRKSIYNRYSTETWCSAQRTALHLVQ